MNIPQDNTGKDMARRLRFGSFEVDLDQRELRNRGIRVHLQKKPFQILELLVSRRGALVTRTELEQHLWPGLHVSFGRGLNTAVNVLRQALGDSCAACRYIETRPGLGYRFLAPVEEVVTATDRAFDTTTDSIAILLFENVTGNPTLETAASRLAEDLIASLSTLESVRVIAHTTAMRYANSGNDPRSLGAALNVRSVLTGRIEIEQETSVLVIRTELVDVKTGRRLCGDRYECSLAGMAELSKSIVSGLLPRLHLPAGARTGLPTKQRYTARPEAYNDYCRGKYLQNKHTEADLGKSLAHFESAIAQDPGYALAYTGLADTYCRFATLGLLHSAEARKRAQHCADCALQKDRDLAEAHISLGHIRQMFDWNYGAAEACYRRALQLSPGSVDGHRAYAAFLSATGQAAAALQEIRIAQELDPLALSLNVEAAKIYYMAGDFQECVRQAWQALVLEAHYAPAQHLLGLAYVEMGLHEEGVTELENARRFSEDDPAVLAALGYAYAQTGGHAASESLLHELEELERQRPISPCWPAIIHAGMRAAKPALAALHRAVEGRDPWLIWLKVEPRLKCLRHEPAFHTLAAAAGFAPDEDFTPLQSHTASASDATQR